MRKLRQAGLDRRLPHYLLVVFPQSPKTPGVGIYSRLPLRPLGPSGNDIVGAAVRMPGGDPVRVTDFHPQTPKPGHIEDRSHSLESLPSTGSGAPRVLLGDFNATLDQVQLRDVVDRGYRDAGDVAGKGLEPTFPRKGWDGLGPFITITTCSPTNGSGSSNTASTNCPGATTARSTRSWRCPSRG